MASSTFNDIAEAAFQILNVFIPGQAIPAPDITAARKMCNRMLGGWSQRGLFIPVIARERFHTVSNQGGPTNPYTIGPGGNWDTTPKPPNQNSITAANLILTTTSPEVRVPLGIYSDQAYDANKLPTMTNTQPTGLYYNPTYANNLGSIHLWPVPAIATNDVELFLQKPLTTFADNTTVYYFPEGADDAIIYQLHLRLAGPWGAQVTPEDRRIAFEVLETFKRSNAHMKDLENDATFATYGRRTLYNINTGQAG
jgi:hypothetical protein